MGRSLDAQVDAYMERKKSIRRILVYAPRGRPDHWDDSCLLLRVCPGRH